MMRDKGYNFYWYDKYAKDIFNPSFIDVSAVNSHYDLITAFEVFEHLENPYEEIKDACNNADTLIFSTAIIPEGLKCVKDWWYFSPESGQHIMFHTFKSLSILAKQFNMHYISLGNFHIYTRKSIDPNAFVRYLNNPSVSNDRKSLLQNDYGRVLESLRKLGDR